VIGNPTGLRVVNIGLPSFAEVAATVAHASVTHLDWRPPLDADALTARLVQRALADERIDEANGRAFDRYVASEPRIVDVVAASHAIPALQASKLLLHAGPPIDVAAMCGPMRGALIGAILFEGWAATADDALTLLDNGNVRCEPCHHHGAVGPMAGVVSPSMAVWVVEDASRGRRAFATLNEGLGRVLRFGAYSPEVVDRLRWMASELGPALGRVIRSLGGVAVKPLIAQALHMGDEVHNRNTASSGQLLKLLAPKIAELETSSAATSVLAFVASNDHFFLNVSMASSKVMLDAASGEPHSTMVTAMARNGVEFGIRTAGTGDAWFCAPALAVDGLYFPGYGPADANPDLGDSAITETAGLGGFSMAAAPAIVGFVGGTPADAIAHSLRMRDITIGVNPAFTIPSLGFAPAAAGIDTRLVVDTAILPVINTGIAHREAGVGQIGAGITNAPWTCFRDALRALDVRQATT
jgi:Protein of unknown function (DUF1116)